MQMAECHSFLDHSFLGKKQAHSLVAVCWGDTGQRNYVICFIMWRFNAHLNVVVDMEL
jgi:hypothetical protein